MQQPSDYAEAVNNGLTALIVSTLHTQRMEESFPSSNPDAMDGKIANCKRRVTLLRKMRDEFENEMSDTL